MGGMDADVQAYIDSIAPARRALFDRMHRLIVEAYPEADLTLSYGMPTYRVGDRRLHLAVWRHGVSIYGWDRDRSAGFVSRHPDLVTGKGTIRLPTAEAADIAEDELRDLVRASLDV